MRQLRILRAGTTRPYLQGGGASAHIIDGWTRAVKALGWSTLLWDGRNADRAFDEFEPDVYLADVRFRHRVPARVKRGQTKVAVTVDQWADPFAFPELARDGYRTRRSHVRWVRRLDAQLLYHHTTWRGIEQGWAKWRTVEGREVVSLPLAGDTEAFFDQGTDPRFDYEIGFLGRYSPYKSAGLDEFLLDFAPEFQTAIFGPGWPTGAALGRYLPDEDRNRFLRTVRVSPCIHEPHGRLYGREITERLFKVPLSGGFTISDPVAAIREEGFFSEDEIPIAGSGEEMRQLIRHFVDHPDERLPYVERAHRRVLREHTYFHRLGTLLEMLGFPEHLSELHRYMSQRGFGVNGPQ